ncbi:MAG: hypothetical protein QOI25_3558, partial [Mycobacterium sp.]|nr:hypothetical protein [Mycobacterium sp.]
MDRPKWKNVLGAPGHIGNQAEAGTSGSVFAIRSFHAVGV